MLQRIVMISASSDSAFDHWLIWAILLSTALALLSKVATDLWPRVVRWSDEMRSRNWPSTPGVVDIAVVAKQEKPGGKGSTGPIVTYLAMLTYSYQNPELQTGDYNREFTYESDAQEWVVSCKGRKVTVRVNPRDSTHSVLRTEDLEATVLGHA